MKKMWDVLKFLNMNDPIIRNTGLILVLLFLAWGFMAYWRWINIHKMRLEPENTIPKIDNVKPQPTLQKEVMLKTKKKKVNSGNVQKIESGGRGIQNNGSPVYGIQNLGDGDIYINAKKELTKEGIEHYLNEIIQKMKSDSVNICEVALHSRGNGDRVFQQLKEALINKGVNVSIVNSYMDREQAPQGLDYSIQSRMDATDINNLKNVSYLRVLVGDF